MHALRASAIAIAAAVVLAGCGVPPAGPAIDVTASPSLVPSPPTILGPLAFPDYAVPIVPDGRPFGTAHTEGFVVSFYEIGRSVARKDSGLVDSITRADVWKAGKPSLYIAAIVTRVDAPDIYVGPFTARLAAYTTAPLDYSAGVAGLTPFDDDFAAQFGITSKRWKLLPSEISTEKPLPLAVGQSIAYVEVMPLLLDRPYTFRIEYFATTPAPNQTSHYLAFPLVRMVFPGTAPPSSAGSGVKSG